MRTPEVLGRIIDDLATVDTHLRWAWNDGLWPTKADRDQARPYVIDDRPPPERTDDDHVPGAKYDTGIGRHRARAAFTTSYRRIQRADYELALAQYQLHITRPGSFREPDQTLQGALQHVALTGQRADAIRSWGPYGAHAHAVRYRALNAARAIDQAWLELRAAFDVGPTDGLATGGKTCRICENRPAADKTGGRCATCHAWKQRNGFERPQTIDEELTGTAKAAAQRRARRGEGYGAG